MARYARDRDRVVVLHMAIATSDFLAAAAGDHETKIFREADTTSDSGQLGEGLSWGCRWIWKEDESLRKSRLACFDAALDLFVSGAALEARRGQRLSRELRSFGTSGEDRGYAIGQNAHEQGHGVGLKDK